MRDRTGGEDFACRMVEARGGTVLCRNYVAPGGEIDIIARQGAYLLFIEVKTRSVSAIARPQEAVTIQKQRRILKTAVFYMMKNPSDLQPRFDVIALTTDHGEFVRSEYIENAWNAGGVYVPF